MPNLYGETKEEYEKEKNTKIQKLTVKKYDDDFIKFANNKLGQSVLAPNEKKHIK